MCMYVWLLSAYCNNVRKIKEKYDGASSVSVEVPLGKTSPVAGIPTDVNGHVVAKRYQI